MSSTNRGGVRASHDFYVTPKPVIEAVFTQLWELDLLPGDLRAILDPCAGGNVEDKKRYAWGMPYVEVMEEMFPGVLVQSVDIRKDSPAYIHEDFLRMKPDAGDKYDMVVGNPPFSLAEEFVRHSRKFLAEGGLTVMLLRLAFLEGQKRKEFFDEWMPMYIFVHRKRISFTGNLKEGSGGTDSVAYAHFVWRNTPEEVKFSKLMIID